MTARKKIILLGGIVAVGSGAWLAWPYVAFSHAVSRAFHEQGVRNDAVKPLFEAVITNKLQVGDSFEQAIEVLNYAGLNYTVIREPHPQPMIQSTYWAGSGSGFSIRLELDRQDRISKIDIREYFTGP